MATANHPTTDRPWQPVQICGASVLFGPLAGAAVAGINFRRMEKPQYLIPCLIGGFVTFLLAACFLMFAVPEQAARSIGIWVGIGIGLGFMFLQKPAFEAWKAANWKPMKEGERYKPTRTGLLFLVGLACLAVEVGIVFVLAFLAVHLHG